MAMKFVSHSPQRIILNVFGDPLTFNLVQQMPPPSKTLVHDKISIKLVTHFFVAEALF